MLRVQWDVQGVLPEFPLSILGGAFSLLAKLFFSTAIASVNILICAVIAQICASFAFIFLLMFAADSLPAAAALAISWIYFLSLLPTLAAMLALLYPCFDDVPPLFCV
jgi:hypothetical protein